MDNKFAVGMIAGGLLTVAGVSYVLNDKKMCNKIVRKSQKMVSKAGSAFDDIVDDVEKMW